MYAEDQEGSLELIRVQSYLTAMLVAGFVNRGLKGKTIPSYGETFRKKQKAMTDEEMFKAVKALNAEMGGEDLRKEADNHGNS
ncbi:MAG: hypothetical protein EOM54_10445 [Clostridia bacterium]|nr:hypothetical protein [Clostridia bacterium]